jgi:hypothetical protein
MKINENDFDREKFFEDPDLEVLVPQLGYLSSALDFAIMKRLMVNLVAPSGSGAFRVTAKFEERFERQVQIVDCLGRTFTSIMVEVMKGFNFGTRTLDFSKANTFNVIQGLIYFLYEKNFRTMLVFENFYRLRQPEMLIALSQLTKLIGKTAIVLHTSPESSIKLSNHRESIIKNAMQNATVCEVRNLEIDELEKYCENCGILNKKVVKDLTEYKPELEVLMRKMDDLRVLLKQKNK